MLRERDATKLLNVRLAPEIHERAKRVQDRLIREALALGCERCWPTKSRTIPHGLFLAEIQRRSMIRPKSLPIAAALSTAEAPISRTVLVEGRSRERKAVGKLPTTQGSRAANGETLAHASSLSSAARASDEPVRSASMSDDRPRIMVVDDDTDSAEAMAVCLAGYDVTVITDPSEALRLIVEGASYHVIISDIMMPGMSGDVLYAEVLVFAPEQAERMIFVTGGGTTAETRAFISTMTGRVVEKPVDLAALIKRVEERLALRIHTK